MGFSQQIISRILTGVSTISYWVVVNGHLSELIPPQQGLRQGDPLSPYLYIIFGEALTRMVIALATR